MLTLVNFIFPVYGFFIGARKIVETRVMLHGILVTLILSGVYATVAASDQLTYSLYFLTITWLHIASVVLLTKYLTKVTVAKTTLKVGNRLPDFVFDDHKGNPITRSAIGEGPILFYFFRGNWCPFCSVQVEALIKEYKNVLAEGIRLAFVSTQSHDEMQKLADKHRLVCHYLIDVDFKFAKQYNLVNRQAVPAPVGQGTDTLYPTLLLLDQHNKILMLEQTDDDRLRPEPEAVLERVKSLGANAYLEEVIARRTAELYKEKEKSEKIILNILPEHTAIELKENGSTQARYYEQVTLFFSDFVGFTRIASSVKPQLLVDSLNAYFKEYDRIAHELGLEKIKTIGDAYMLAGGLPIRDPEHARKCCEFALRIFEVDEKLRETNEKAGLCVFESRAGIHTGPVMAGVVGEKKFCYDIWGDTVNLAARMEGCSEKGRINISDSTYQLIKDVAIVEPRGCLQVKNHDKHEMYFLNGLSR